MKKVIINIIEVAVSAAIVLLVFEMLSWYHIGHDPTFTVAGRMVISLIAVYLAIKLFEALIRAVIRFFRNKNKE